MLDDLIWKLFPPGGDVLAGIVQAVMWFGAIASLGMAVLCGAVRLAARQQPRPATVPIGSRDLARPMVRAV